MRFHVSENLFSWKGVFYQVMKIFGKRWWLNFLIFVLEKWSFEIILHIFQVHVVRERGDFSVVNCAEWLTVAAKIEFFQRITSYRICHLKSLCFCFEFCSDCFTLTTPDGGTALINMSLYSSTPLSTVLFPTVSVTVKLIFRSAEDIFGTSQAGVAESGKLGWN